MSINIALYALIISNGSRLPPLSLWIFQIKVSFVIFPLSKSRNHNGTFKKGFTPWNKNLKIEIGKRDKKGKFVKGNKSLIVGSKDNNEEET